MTKKKDIEQKAPMGKRINGRAASKERYIQFYEFLLFDPVYRGMKDKAKILYSYLKKKTLDNEKKMEEFQEDDIGTKSYADENGEIFCLADNSELSIILQCHPNRVKDQKDELKRYGLMDEVPQYQKASRLYICEPENLSERWMYIEEMKSLRAETVLENKAKAEKYKSKEKVTKQTVENEKEKVPGKSSVEADSKHNSQNVSYSNSQKVSYYNSQNVSKIYSKGFKSILKPKSTLNLSINEEIDNSSLPIPMLKILDDRIDRMVEFKLKVSDIELHFNAVKENFEIAEYGYILSNLIDKMTFKPKNFADVMDNWLNRNRLKQNAVPVKEGKKQNPVREETVGDFLKEELEVGFEQAASTVEGDSEQVKKDLQNKWKAWKNGSKVSEG
ncbi:replication initiator protein A [Peribacillus simplex]|uniref:replication initiator protein A n=1 Tax=Peribacillus simplex TaxID=1478 RepID=UPI00298D6D0C|nr:replication initiator protein A [Peribacillus simplex]MDW7617377.1 replication initiator protein A [Peribacillus simplex]